MLSRLTVYIDQMLQIILNYLPYFEYKLFGLQDQLIESDWKK